MGTALHERPGPPADGLVARALLGLAAIALVAAIAGGLVRAGVIPAFAMPSLAWATVSHATLMISAFFGTVIGLERAVALGHRAAFVAPLAAGAGGVAALAGAPLLAGGSFVAASAAFVAVNVVIVRRQPALHTALLLAAAFAWFAGAVLSLAAVDPPATLAFGFIFLVGTIAAERLELTRLMRRRPGARPMLAGVVVAMLTGAVAGVVEPVGGGALYGLSMAALAAWLMRYDVARRTIGTAGASRYMAACLLAGYGWLLVGGLAWAATAVGLAVQRDMALHAVGLGFVFGMVMAHALVIVPAVARIPLVYRPVFYLPFALLHGSLALRLFGGEIHSALRLVGSAGNAFAIATFVATVVISARLGLRAERERAARTRG